MEVVANCDHVQSAMKKKDNGVMPYLPDVAGITAPVVAEVDYDGASSSALFTISTISQDRDGDVVIPKGCLPLLKNYQANPVVLFDHGAFPLPVGLSEDPQTKTCTVVVSEDRIIARAFFHCKTSESSQVAALVDAKVLRAASIGYRGIKGKPVGKGRGTIFEEWELVEWSIVPIPANQDALRMALSAKWDGKKLAAPIAKAFKSLILPSTKVIVPAGVKSTQDKRMKAMPADEIPHDADQTVVDDASSGEGEVEMPHGAKGIKALMDGVSAAVSVAKEMSSGIEHPDAIKCMTKCMGGIDKCMKALHKSAYDIYPKHFDAPADEEGQEPGEEENIEIEDGEKPKDAVVDNEGQEADEDDDVSNLDKPVKRMKAWGKECDSHIANIKDAAELLDDVSKSPNIPSGYKRQAKGVLPGLNQTCSWISDKALADCEGQEAGQDESTAIETGGDAAGEDDAKEEAEAVKALKLIADRASKNAKELAAIKGKRA